MRLNALIASAVPAAMLIFSAAIAPAQVAPAAKVGGYPIAISAGVSDYDIDYGFSRRMEGLVIRGGVHVFHGLGVDVSARSIFMNTPARVTRMQQNTFLAGAYYDAPAIWHLRPFVRYAGGIGTIEFPSRNPNYTRDSFTVYAPSGGVEYLVSPRAAIRAEYEYQSWMKYQGPKQLNPQGWTIGATYYLRGKRMRAHPMD